MVRTGRKETVRNNFFGTYSPKGPKKKGKVIFSHRLGRCEDRTRMELDL